MASTFTREDAVRAPYLPLLRALVRAYHGFLEVSGAHVKALGLTHPQFDVIATLGNTPGMTLGDLASRTLITKSSLTGIVDRLEERGLVERCDQAGDRRCVRARLTPKGDELFGRAFPRVVSEMNEIFSQLTAEEQATCRTALERLRGAFDEASGNDRGVP